MKNVQLVYIVNQVMRYSIITSFNIVNQVMRYSRITLFNIEISLPENVKMTKTNIFKEYIAELHAMSPKIFVLFY